MTLSERLINSRAVASGKLSELQLPKNQIREAKLLRNCCTEDVRLAARQQGACCESTFLVKDKVPYFLDLTGMPVYFSTPSGERSPIEGYPSIEE